MNDSIRQLRRRAGGDAKLAGNGALAQPAELRVRCGASTLLLVGLMGAAACTDARPLVDDRRACTSWREDIEPLFADRCAECHGGAFPAAGWDASTYLGALGPGLDPEPNAVAGRADSKLVTVLDPSTADATHAPHTDIAGVVRTWVVDCDLSYFRSRVHDGGILNPADEAFHGATLRELDYHLGACATCHGGDFAGGAAGASCLGCHEDGPADCSVCHGVPESGAHHAHVDPGPSAVNEPLECTACHPVPAAVIVVLPGAADDPAAAARVANAPHLDGRVDILFNALAATDTAARQGPPSYDASTGTCTNVYCHGDALGDALGNVAGVRTEPTWDGGPGQAACGTCHGVPPANHGASACASCHAGVDAGGEIIDPVAHLDGTVDVGTGCGDCHGSESSPAPPVDLQGHTTTDALGVGAHQSHLEGTHRLRGPITCEECHLVPQAVGDAGHVDSELPAEVYPDGVTGLAAADGAPGTWDRATGTCAVYCHGAGTSLSADAGALEQRPSWTAVGVGEAACARCHGVPPVDGVHDPSLQLDDCAACHPQTVDAFGNPLVTGGDSTHINGVVDAP